MVFWDRDMDDKNIDVKEKVNFIVVKFIICFNIL